MQRLLGLLLLFSTPLLAQDPVYNDFEVQQAAQPRGGLAYLETFVQANLRKPVPAQAAGVGGRVFLSGIVEPDGRLSNVTVVRGLRPDCDREARRVFGLFQAWSPARIDGKPVRQAVAYPVVFKPNTPFRYVNGARVDYFDADGKPLADSSQLARRKLVSPLDTNGLPNGDLVIFKGKGGVWKEDFRLPLIRKRLAQQAPSGKPVYALYYEHPDTGWQGFRYEVDEAGAILSQTYYENGRPVGPNYGFAANGTVMHRHETAGEQTVDTYWYPSGQIRMIRTQAVTKPPEPAAPEKLMAQWDSAGQPRVTNGNGQARYSQRIRSLADTNRRTEYVQQGAVQDGLKQGVWTGRYADGSYFYKEQYDRGVCQGGRAWESGKDTIRYTVPEQQPEFAGGMAGLGQFLQQTLRYPPDAQRAGAQGRVFISFVVCTDGTLCDYEVIKSVHPDLDREALHVVEAMSGRWKPGVQRGRKVRVKYNLPINFALSR